MPVDTQNAPVSKSRRWVGYIVSALPVLLLCFSGGVKLTNHPSVIEANAKFGIAPHLILGIGILELACTALYVIPRTAAVGAILLTGYLGGAVFAHLRVGDPFFFPILTGGLLWLSLLLRDDRLRAALLPVRKNAPAAATYETIEAR